MGCLADFAPTPLPPAREAGAVIVALRATLLFNWNAGAYSSMVRAGDS